MTTDEHMLLMLLVFKQNQAIRILLDMLRSREILTADDEAAFSSSQIHNLGSNAALFDEARQNYLTIAHSLGIQTGLEQMPEPPLDWFRPPK